MFRFKRTAVCKNDQNGRVIVRRWRIDQGMMIGGHKFTVKKNQISRSAPATNPGWENE